MELKEHTVKSYSLVGELTRDDYRVENKQTGAWQTDAYTYGPTPGQVTIDRTTSAGVRIREEHFADGTVSTTRLNLAGHQLFAWAAGPVVERPKDGAAGTPAAAQTQAPANQNPDVQAPAAAGQAPANAVEAH